MITKQPPNSSHVYKLMASVLEEMGLTAITVEHSSSVRRNMTRLEFHVNNRKGRVPPTIYRRVRVKFYAPAKGASQCLAQATYVWFRIRSEDKSLPNLERFERKEPAKVDYDLLEDIETMTDNIVTYLKHGILPNGEKFDMVYW